MGGPHSKSLRVATTLAGPLLLLAAACADPPAGALSGATGGIPAQSAATADPGANLAPTPAAEDPANWSDEALAAELVFAANESPDLAHAESWARKGVAGLLLLSNNPSKYLKQQLTDIRSASPDSRLLVGSDEEGGLVQRLDPMLPVLPSAETIGRTMTPDQAQALAFRYGQQMKALGVNVSFAPVADVAVRGSFIANDHRSFSADPVRDGEYVGAWVEGLRRAGVMGVLKHWPGHGSSTDTHVGSGTTPAWAMMKKRDLVPFDAGLADGACAVMVGHLLVPGLTEPGTPASMSPAALAELRGRIGPGRLIITDSLSMAAVTDSMNQSQDQAAIRSLSAGADLVILNTPDPLPTVGRIASAIRSGSLPRDSAVASARRVLAAAEQWSMTSQSGPSCN